MENKAQPASALLDNAEFQTSIFGFNIDELYPPLQQEFENKSQVYEKVSSF